MSIDRSLDVIDAAWLTRLLEQTYPGVAVTSAEVVDAIRGTSTKVRVVIRTNEAGRAAGLPDRLIVKAGFESHSAGKHPMHLNEMNAYRALIPSLEGALDTPACYFAGQDDTGRAVLLIEDLTARDVRFLDLKAPLDFDTAARFLDRIARLHARWWSSPELFGERFAWTPRPGADHIVKVVEGQLSPETFASYLPLPRAMTVPREVRDPGRIGAALKRLAELYQEMPRTICHGDTHLGNLYVSADGEPGFLDWIPRRAPWCQDVSYFITGALDWPDRRRWEGALLQHYLTRLSAMGVASPAFDDAWLAYRRDLAWGVFVWLLNSSKFQSEENNTAATTRFAVAAVDHDTFGLLGV